MVDGYGWLFEHAADGSRRQLAEDFTRYRQLAANQTHVFCIAGAPERAPAVLAIEMASGAVRILVGGAHPRVGAHMSLPQPIRFPTVYDQVEYAFILAERCGWKDGGCT